MKWFSKKPKQLFLSHERLVLDAVQAALPPDLQQRFREQIESVNVVQRHGNGQEVNMYRDVGGRVVLPAVKLIQSEEEVVLATVVLGSPASKARPVGKVWVVRGHVFQVMFNAKRERLSLCDSVVSVELGPAVTQAPKYVDGLGSELIAGAEVSEVLPPLSPDRLASALSLIAGPLPPDYLELVTRTNGFSYAGWKVLGLEDVYDAPGSGGAYVIAELREGDAGLALVARKGELSVVRMDDSTETPLAGLGFVAALDAAPRMAQSD